MKNWIPSMPTSEEKECKRSAVMSRPPSKKRQRVGGKARNRYPPVSKRPEQLSCLSDNRGRQSSIVSRAIFWHFSPHENDEIQSLVSLDRNNRVSCPCPGFGRSKRHHPILQLITRHFP